MGTFWDHTIPWGPCEEKNSGNVEFINFPHSHRSSNTWRPHLRDRWKWRSFIPQLDWMLWPSYQQMDSTSPHEPAQGRNRCNSTGWPYLRHRGFWWRSKARYSWNVWPSHECMEWSGLTTILSGWSVCYDLWMLGLCRWWNRRTFVS